MNKTTLRPIALGIVLLVSLFLGSAAWSADRPNFFWLISEDNSKHYLKLFDGRGAPTPNIEKLADHGIVFDRAFSNAPVCSVARTTLITGCYAPRLGTQYHRRSKLVPLPEKLQMFPAYLREAGYYTTNKAKKDYNAIEGKGVWDASSNRATWRNRPSKDTPFFHKQSFGMSHESSLHFPREQMERAELKTSPNDVTLSPRHPDTPTFRYTYARYHDRIGLIDDVVGSVVAELEKDGLLEDTFIFYFGDHGGVLPGSKGYINEVGLHVPLVVRIPEKWKHLVSFKPGTRNKGVVSFVDFGPTLLNLAGLQVPKQMDGRPFLGKRISPQQLATRDEAFGYADRFDEKYDLVRTLRKGDLKYVRSYQPFNFDALYNKYRYKMLAYQEWRDLYRAGKLNEVQSQFFEPRAPEALYDLATDPYETKNLAGDPRYAEALADMRRRLAERVKGLPDLSFLPESYLVDHGFDNPVAFGLAHRDEIARLVDVADLSLVPFAEAQARVAKALASRDPWQRYWGLIVSSSHGEAAEGFVETAKKLAASDSERLVRVRAAEFLGLLGAVDPRPTIAGCLLRSKSPVEANLILNTAVLLQDGKPGYRFDLPRGKIIGDRPNEKARYVSDRLDYLAEGP